MNPRIAFLGVGDYGSRYVSRLIKAGLDVTIIARGSTLKRLQTEGLHVPESTYQPEAVTLRDIKVSGNPAEIGEVDFLVISVKLYQLDQACRDALPLVGPNTTVIPLSNGVDAPDRAAKHFGADRVIGASTSGPMAFGEWPRGTSKRTEQIASLFSQAGIAAQSHENVLDPIWRKFIVFAGNAPVCAVARQPVGVVGSIPELVDLAMQATREITVIANKLGVENTDADEEKMLGYWANSGSKFRPSMLQDLDAGRPLEMDAACGTVIRLGKQHGIPTPVNSFLYAALKPYENGS